MNPRVRKSDRRRAYALEHPVVLTLAWAAIAFGVLFLLQPHILAGSAVGQGAPKATEAYWAALMASGGVLIWAGFHKMDARYEVAGLSALAVVYLCQTVAVFYVRGFTTGVVAASTYVALFLGCIVRALILVYEPDLAAWKKRGHR